MLRAQIAMELKLLLRHGEQLLLTMFIPITLLVGITLIPIGDLGDTRVATVLPAVMMVAVMSTAFTGQAIAVGFDRRYGALKRIGATALPRWGIIGGKSGAVLVVVALQSLLLGAIGVALGWRPDAAGLALGAVVIAVGTVTFAAMGLLLGGTLRAEIVLALANIVWFVLLGVGSLVMLRGDVPQLWIDAARVLPSGAMAHALDAALAGSLDWISLVVLALWAAVSAAAAVRFFRFT
ncbi:multidrug ABC transporter permease [Rhodococcus rhodnii]|uniref:ABC transporter permease n=3 Tax=Rhodococcus rhodnii TaxID=38312 RepID=R7WIH4_9NOCA|nr:ABC transporter permease [Rhodococcus rhodnii LMG 5362]TXG92697.1 multidrug ABC transporter permease [Rhodococcus rhodnii]